MAPIFPLNARPPDDDWHDVLPHLDFSSWGKVVSAACSRPKQVTAASLWTTIKDAFTLKRLDQFMTAMTKHIRHLVAETGLTLNVIADALRTRNVFQVLKALGFALARCVVCVKAFAQLYADGILSVCRTIAESDELQKLKKGTRSVDDLLHRYPLLRRMTGPAIAGFLLWCFLTANFTSVPSLDMDMTSVITAAFKGEFSLEDLFTSPSGVLLLTTLFTALAGLALPTPFWLSTKPPINLLTAFVYTGLRHLPQRSPYKEALASIRARIHSWVTPARLKPMLPATAAASLETAAPRIAKDADMGLLGVSSSETPAFSRFPSTFNKKASTYWRNALETDAYRAALKKADSSAALWRIAIQQYLKLCEEADVFPFSGAQDFEATAKSFLENARRTLVAFVDKHDLLKHLKVVSVQRNYEFTDKNFHIVVVAKLRPIEDPTFTAFLKRLPEPSFSVHADGVYRKKVHAHVDVEFTQDRAGNATLGYRIFCHTPIHLIRPEIPSRKRLATYADRQLWIPIIKSLRFKGKGAANKLF